MFKIPLNSPVISCGSGPPSLPPNPQKTTPNTSPAVFTRIKALCDVCGGESNLMQSTYDKLGENVCPRAWGTSLLAAAFNLLRAGGVRPLQSSPKERRGTPNPHRLRLFHPPPILTEPGSSPTSRSVLIGHSWEKSGRREVYSSFSPLSPQHFPLIALQKEGETEAGGPTTEERAGAGSLLAKVFPLYKIKRRGGKRQPLWPLSSTPQKHTWRRLGKPTREAGAGEGAPGP